MICVKVLGKKVPLSDCCYFVADGDSIAGRIAICAEIRLQRAGVTSGNEERPEVSCSITAARLEQPIRNTQLIAKHAFD